MHSRVIELEQWTNKISMCISLINHWKYEYKIHLTLSYANVNYNEIRHHYILFTVDATILFCHLVNVSIYQIMGSPTPSYPMCC